jgi:hypothetical protein
VIGVQGKSHVEGALHDIVRSFAGEGVKEIGSETELRIARDNRFSLPQAVEGSDDGRRLRHETHRFAVIGLGRHVLRFGIVDAQHRDGRAENVHRTAGSDAAEKIDDLLGQAALGHQFLAELIQFGLLGQPAVPEEEDNLFENGVVREGVNIVTAVAQDTQVSVDVANFRFARNDAFEPSHCRFHGSPFSESIVCRGPRLNGAPDNRGGGKIRS